MRYRFLRTQPINRLLKQAKKIFNYFIKINLYLRTPPIQSANSAHIKSANSAHKCTLFNLLSVVFPVTKKFLIKENLKKGGF